MKMSKPEKIAMILIAVPLWSFMLLFGGLLLLAVIDVFLALDFWPWAECLWVIDDVWLDYPAKRCTSAVQLTPQAVIDWLAEH